MSDSSGILAHPAVREFNEHLARSRYGVFCLDYDGTLAPFVRDAGDARPYAGVPEALDGLMACGRARLIIVSGRFLRGTPPVLDTRWQPEIWGSHGRERLLPDGSYTLVGVDEFSARALAIADGWSTDIEASGGRCEPKPGSLAVHWRGAAPAQVAAIRKLVETGFAREAFDGVLELRHFDGGIELRAPGFDKGDVVRTVLAEVPQQAPLAYLGDDLTDEDAFRALRGRGLGVLVRPRHRPTAADVWIRPDAELLPLLTQWRCVLAADA